MFDPWFSADDTNHSQKLKNELKESKELRDVTAALRDFQKENNQKAKVGLFLNFLSLYEGFLVNNSNEKIAKLIIPKTFPKILDYAEMASQYIQTLVQSIRLLSLSNKMAQFIPRAKNIIILFNFCCKYALAQPKIMQISTDLFTTLFKNQNFVIDYSNQDGYVSYLKQVLCGNTNDAIISWSLSIIVDTPAQETFGKIDPSNLLTSFVSIASSDLIPRTSMEGVLTLMAKIIRYGSPCSPYFISKLLESNVFYFIDKIIEELNLTENELLNSLKLRLHLFEIANTKYKQMFLPVCGLLFSYLSKHEITSRKDIPYYDYVFRRIMILINNSTFTYAQLNSVNFLDAFVIGLPTKVLADFISSPKKCFNNVVLSVFSLSEAIPKQPSVFSAVLKTGPLLNFSSTFFVFCTNLVSAAPTASIVKCLLSETTQTRSSVFCDILQAILVQMEKLAHSFIKADGLEWLEESHSSNLITIDQFSNILSNLVVFRRFDEVDNFIFSLPKDHPIFSQPKPALEKIVYGLNSAKNRPIRVYSLFLYIDGPDCIDPYNAWMLGNCLIDHFLSEGKSIFDFPYIKDVANRFLHPKHIEYLLERPFGLEQFACLSYDHFPLFQLYQGKDEFKITNQFKCMSFWVKFHGTCELLKPFFKTDCLTISCAEGAFIIQMEGKTQKVEVNTSNWTFIYINSEDSFLSSTVTVYIQESPVFKSQKPQKSDFTFAYFGSYSNNLMFIGPAIRLFKENTTKVREIISNGPGNVDLVEEFKIETIITPYFFTEPYSTVPNTSMTKLCAIPSTCVTVPYFGFPFHFISMRKNTRLISILNDAKTDAEYRALFSTLLNINILIMHNSSGFWDKILGSLKKYKKFVSKEVFLQALKSVAEHKHGDHLLSSILFDSDMWSSVNNEILVQVLFDYFSNTNWLRIENFELFLTTVIMRNPTSTVIVDTILKNYKSLPMMLKYIFSIFKISHVLDAKTITWDLLVARFETPVQSTIIESLSNFVAPDTIDTMCQVLTFSKVRLFLLVSPNPLAAKLFHLAVLMEKQRSGYFEVDNCLLYRVALLSHIKSTWEDVFFLVTGSWKPELSSTINETFIPFFLALIWSLSLCYAHSFAYFGKSCDNLQHFDEYYDFAVRILQQNIKAVIKSQFCCIILRSWFPLVFSYPMLIKSMMETGNDSNSELVLLSQLSETRDPTWNGKEQIINSIHMPPCPLPVSPTIFVVEMMSAVLRNHALDFTTPSGVQQNGIGRWLTNASLSKLIADLILSSPQQMMSDFFLSIFLSVPFYERIRVVNYVPVILRILLERFTILYTPSFSLEQLLRFIQFFVSQKMFQNSADHFIEMLLGALETVGAESKEIQKTSVYINAIILDVITSAPESMFSKITASLSMHAKLFCTVVQVRKLQKTWEYAFSILSSANPPAFNTLMDQFIEYAKPDAKDKCIINALKHKELALNKELYSLVEMDWIQNTTDFTQECSKISMTIAASRGFFQTDFTSLSHALNKGKYTANCKHYLTAHFFSRKLLCLDGTFTLIEERMHWAQFIISLRDSASFIASFAPKTYHLCPRCFPFASPRLVSPSPFPYQDMNIPDHRFSSPIVELFRKNSKSLFTKQQTNDVSLNELFANCTKNEFGSIVGLFPCKLIRYTSRINSVLFVFHSMLMILTHAIVLPNGEIELRPTNDEKELHIFLESVFLGHWGYTSIFASHILLFIPLEHMIYSRQHSPKEIEIWTFQNGNFILKMKKKHFSKVFQMLKKYNEKAISQLSSYQFLFKTTTSAIAYQQWTSSFLSTDQFLLVMNGLASRSFVDLQQFPFFPCVNKVVDGKRKLSFVQGIEPPDADSTLDRLRRLLPFAYYYKKTDQSTPREIPAILFYAPEFYKDLNNLGVKDEETDSKSAASFVQVQRDAIESGRSSNAIVQWTMRLFGIQPTKKVADDSLNESKDSSSSNRVSQNHSNIADLELFHVCQKVELKCKAHQILTFEQNDIRKNRFLSARLEANKSNYVQVDKRTLTLSCFNKITKKIHCAIVDPLLIFACSLSLSVNGMFLVVDFEFGLSRTYRILYAEQLPASIQMISDFSWSVKPQSAISGVDWIVATSHEDHLIIWEVFTGSVHRNIHFSEMIECVAIDEENGGIYVMTVSEAFYYSINGEEMAKSTMKETVTVIAPLQLHPADRDRTCIIGCANGHIYVVSPRVDQGTIDFKKLPSQHRKTVNRISLHPSLCEFMSIDTSGTAYVWNAIGLGAPPLIPTVFSHCATCFEKPLYRCNICNRVYCAHCMSEQIRGVCSHCAALSGNISLFVN